MNTHELTEQILRDATRKSADMHSTTLAEVEKIESEGKDRLKEKREKLYKEVKQQEHDARERIKAQQQRDEALALLTCKQELIDQVFAEAQQKLTKLPAAQRKKLLTHLWNTARKRMKIKSIVAAKKDAAFFRRKVKTTTMNASGGFIATDGSGVFLDYRFDTLLERTKETRRTEIAQVLFK